MLFPTLEFSIFALLSLSVWLIFSKEQAKLPLLIIFNICFYSYYNPSLIFYLIAWTCLIWLAGKYLKLSYFIIGVAILQLVFWKMIEAKFFEFHPIATPLGISFFTFQGLTYLFARMKLPSHRPEEHIENSWSLAKTFGFIGFFPTVLSGPILRAKYWENQLVNLTPLSKKTFNYAFACIALGAFYKLCLSSIFHDYVSLAFANPKEESVINLLIGLYAYTFEIYHDFAGYSLMAIGIALLYGFDLPDNFKQPYLSLNIREFWQKWHISFSTWLRDYFYITLGGSRVSLGRHLMNTMIIMIVCGAWHGLSGNYLIWGAMHGLAVCFYHMIKNKIKIPSFVAWFITFHYVAFAWIFFRSPDIQTGVDYIVTLLNHLGNLPLPSMKELSIFILFVFAFIMQKIEPVILNKSKSFIIPIWSSILAWSFVFIFILIVSPSGMPPFIYFSY